MTVGSTACKFVLYDVLYDVLAIECITLWVPFNKETVEHLVSCPRMDSHFFRLSLDCTTNFQIVF